MNKNKKWCILTLSVTLAALFVIAITVVLVDPFFHYHKPFEMIPYTLNNQTYQNPGIVKYFEYDSLITGTSMTENFKTSYFKEVLGANAVKVSYSGGRSKNMSIILNKALESNPSLKTIYLGLDLYMMKNNDTEQTRNPLPIYLYNSNPFDDVQYLYNKDVLFSRVVPSIRGALRSQESTTFDKYSHWHNSFTFSQYTVIGSNLNIKKAEMPGFSYDEAIRIADSNLQKNILPIIEKYPNTEFVIFYPPYSIIYWYQNFAEYELGILEYSIKKLLPYENVKLFLFQNNADIVTNLYNYKDYTHYSEDINTYMVDSFKNGAHQLTVDNYEAELNSLKDLVLNFDFGLLFGENNPFIQENNYLKYLESLSEDKYITFVSARMESPVTSYDIFGDKYMQFGLNSKESGYGYAAIINGDTTIFQDSSDDAIIFNNVVEGLNVNLVSEKCENINYVEIVIDGVKYTTNQMGVNIVVYDTEYQRVMDNISIDLDNMRISRK